MAEVSTGWPKAIIVKPAGDGAGTLALEGQFPDGEFEPAVYLHSDTSKRLALSIALAGADPDSLFKRRRIFRKNLLIQLAVSAILGFLAYLSLGGPTWAVALQFLVFGWSIAWVVQAIGNDDLYRRYNQLRKDVAEVSEIAEALDARPKGTSSLH